VSLQNHGHLISGERVIGDTDENIANNYDRPVQGNAQEGALVDSYIINSKYKSDGFDNTGKNIKVKIEKGRGTSEDSSNIPGTIFTFNKES